MTIRHLKIFMTVADCNGMSAAAQKLHISQPTVSQAVAEMEKYYGVRLFERFSQKLYITEEGKRLLSYSRHIVDSFENMEKEMLNSGKNSVVRIGCSVSVGTCRINDLLDEAERSVPECRVQVVVDNSSAIENMILTNAVDFGIVEGIITSSELDLIPIYEDELVIVCGRNYPLARQGKVSLSELEGENLISRESGSIERNQLEKILEERHIRLNRCFSSTNTEAIKNAVIHGRGIAILSRMLVEKECSQGEMICLDFDEMPVKRTIHLAKHKNKYIFDGMKRMMELCKERYDKK